MPATAPKRSDAGDAPVEVLEEIFLELKETHGSMDILTDIFDLIEEEDEERLLINKSPSPISACLISR